MPRSLAILLQQSLAHHRDLGLDLLHVRARLQPGEGEHAASGGIGQEVATNSALDQIHAQRKISLHVEQRRRPQKTFWRDSNHGDGMTVNRNRLPDRRGITAEASSASSCNSEQRSGPPPPTGLPCSK